MLAGTACGGSSTGLAATCSKQAALLDGAGAPSDLDEAADAARLAIRVERTLAAELTRSGDRAGLVARLRAGEAAAALVLAMVARTDPQQSMAPLRTGVASSRRTLEQARALLREACS